MFGWILVAAFIGYLIGRPAVYVLWRRGRLSHRRAAILVATSYLAFVLIFAPGAQTGRELLALGGLAALVLLSGFASAEFVFKWLGGEFDPQGSAGHSQRPRTGPLVGGPALISEVLDGHFAVSIMSDLVLVTMVVALAFGVLAIIE